MFERFTDRARKAVALAQEEARMLGHDYIGAEHLLLGLLHEGGGVAARALERMGVSLDQVRRDIMAIVGPGPGAPVGHVPFTPGAKKLSLREAHGLGHNYIGTEHMLLALIRQGDGVAAEVLRSHGLGLERVRATVVDLLAGSQPIAAGSEPDAEPSTEYEARSQDDETTGEADTGPRFPTCPSRLAPLGEWLRTRAMDAEGSGSPVTIAYCGRCGVAIGTVP